MIEEKKWFYNVAPFEFEDPKKAKDRAVTASLIEALNLETFRDCTIELRGKVIRVNSKSLSRVSLYFNAILRGGFVENGKRTQILHPTDDEVPEFRDLKAVDKFATDGFVKYSNFEKVADFFQIDNIKTSNTQINNFFDKKYWRQVIKLSIKHFHDTKRLKKECERIGKLIPKHSKPLRSNYCNLK